LARVAVARDPGTGALLDRVVVTIYDAPRSYTGEDMVEICCHGGRLSPVALLASLVAGGAREAEPGEYTRRAVLNGKLDVLQAEGVADIVDARTEAARRASLHQIDGGLSRRISALHSRVLEVEALLAYEIDFPEEDAGPVDPERVETATVALVNEIQQLLATVGLGEAVRDGARIVIAGRPNVGKSSLLNALVGYRRAIVSDEPGTTRDAIEVLLDGGRWPLRVIDTAGLRESEDEVEREGVAVSRRYLAGAHVVLVCDDDVGMVEASCRLVRASTTAGIVAVRTKSDLDGSAAVLLRPADAGRIVRVSSVTREGLPELVSAVEQLLDEQLGAFQPESPVVVRTRHRVALDRAASELGLFLQSWRSGALPMAVAAVHVRSAAQALETLIGAVDIEDVLGRVFSEFCVGK
jgi:tRNA modification GTPase